MKTNFDAIDEIFGDYINISCAMHEELREKRGFVLIGKSGSGKTTLLRQLNASINQTVIFQGYEIIELLFDRLETEFSNLEKLLEKYTVLLLDEMDVLYGKEATTQQFVSYLNALMGGNTSNLNFVILSFRNEVLAHQVAQMLGYEEIYL